MRKTNLRLLSLVASAAAMSLFSTPAHARGCNGIVQQWRWYCAIWDNNNGPNFPFWTKAQTSIPGGAQVRIKDSSAEVLVNGQWLPVVGGTSAIVAAGGGNIVAAGGGNIVAAGGGNLRALTGQ